ncbi:solute carrier family 22 member 15-like [Aplysia californica]|uniref:Solute carrier family 22 member 15-like n=1 Tax=Aplysia californica TaxID=6500 RepID=A0ABM0K9V3_APLCA|nr:solute carrier family 22 member 15-like [Aplysia californica]
MSTVGITSGQLEGPGRVLSFADDVLVFRRGKDRQEIANAGQQELDRIGQWCVDHYAELHNDKACVLWGSLNNHAMKTKMPTVTINDRILKRVHSLRYLGITFDRSLSCVFDNFTIQSKLLINSTHITPFTDTQADTSPDRSALTEEERCELMTSSCSDIRFSPEASTIVSEWRLVCARSWLASLVISVQMSGVAVGCVAAGWVGNKFGRRVSLYMMVGLSAVANTLAAFSNSLEMFAILRFFIGASVGGNLSINQVYPKEFVTAKWRVILAAIPAFHCGNILFGVLVYVLRDWRHIHMATAAVSLAALPTVFWVPESLRWLAVHGRVKDALAVANKVCRYNRKSELEEKDMVVLEESEVRALERKSTVCHLLQKPLRKRSIVGFCLFFIMAFIFYSIGFGVKNLFGNLYLKLIFFFFFVVPLLPIMATKLGRKRGIMIYFAIACLTALVVLILLFTSSSSSLGLVVTIFSLIISTAADQALSLMAAFMVELFPTYVRTLAYSFVYFGARLGGILAPYLFPRSSELLYISFVVIGCLTVTCMFMVWTLPETRKRGLGDTTAATSKM